LIQWKTAKTQNYMNTKTTNKSMVDTKQIN